MVRDEGDGGEGDGEGACHVAKVAAHPGTAGAGDVRASVSEAWKAFGAGGLYLQIDRRCKIIQDHIMRLRHTGQGSSITVMFILVL